MIRSKLIDVDYEREDKTLKVRTHMYNFIWGKFDKLFKNKKSITTEEAKQCLITAGETLVCQRTAVAPFMTPFEYADLMGKVAEAVTGLLNGIAK